MVRIITDSAADLEPVELERMAVTCVPLSVFFGDTEYRENINLSKAEFYEMLSRAEEFPRSSQPSPQAFMNAYQEAIDKGEEAVVITLSSNLSGTYQSACMAREMRDQGLGAKEIAEEVEKLRSRVVLYTCMETLEYLHRGGRISRTVYRIGSLAHVKPIMHVDPEGRAEIPAKTIGMRRGMEFICQRVREQKPDGGYPLYVMYTQYRENGELLAKKLAAQGCPVPPERIIPVGAAIGTHIGPHAVGVVYIEQE